MAQTERIEGSLLGRFWPAFNAVPLALCASDRSLNTAALDPSVRLDHPIHDCLYLALALDRGAALATSDRRSLRVVTRAAALSPDRLLTPPEGAA